MAEILDKVICDVGMMKNKAEKKKIAIIVSGGRTWIGGLYYRINILFELLQNEYIKNNFEIIVITDNENEKIVREFFGNIKTLCISATGMIGKFKLLAILIKEHCLYVYVNSSKKLGWFGIKAINWVPDFQHNRLPKFFTDYEIKERTESIKRSNEATIPLVLSSKDAFNDLKTYYKLKEEQKVYIVPFTSYIIPYLRKITREKEISVLNLYGLKNEKYTCIMNQFWQHKNHRVVLQAIDLLVRKNPNITMKFVMTGNLCDYRNSEYVNVIRNEIRNLEAFGCIKLLGFIERVDQLILMKNAEFIIQPSLFEGWSTVVEDAKVLDKTILLSDIPVHREQMSNKCIFFNPYDPYALARLIEVESEKEHVDDIETGVDDMYRRSKEYSKGFEQLLKDMEW